MSVNVERELAELKAKVESTPGAGNKLTMVIMSGSLDRQLAAMIIATGAAALGMEVVLFILGNSCASRSAQEGERKEPHVEDVWLHASQGQECPEAVPDEHGEDGNSIDEGAYEEKERGEP